VRWVLQWAADVALILAVGALGYGAATPGNWPAFVISLVIGAAAFGSLGMAVSAFIPNFEAAPAIVNLVFLVLLVISGGFFPVASNSAIAQAANIFPLRHLLLAASASVPGTRFPWWHIGITAAWGAAAFALCYFRCSAR
jgi:ABC-2 type transport system permease protein